MLETEFKTYKGNFIKSEITAYPILDFDGSIDSFTIVVKSLEVDSSVNKEPEEIVKEVIKAVSYTHLRAHETVLDIVCRLLLEKKTKSYMSIEN